MPNTPITVLNYPWENQVELVSLLGKGGYGSVYKAKQDDPLVGVDWSAVKVMHIQDDPDTAVRLGNEIKIMQQLSGHPNIVQIKQYKTYKYPDNRSYDIFIRMELLNSFEERIQGKSLPPVEVVRLGTTMCDVLTELEKNNIVHRDIKPSNILVDNEGNYKLGDFGIARVIDSNSTHTVTGTPVYAAPEIDNGHYDHRVDIYSLGLTLWVCLNKGVIPFAHIGSELTPGDFKHAYIQLQSGQALPNAADATPALMAVIRKACAFKPNDRYRTAAEFKAALEQCVSVPQPQPQPQQQQPQPAPVASQQNPQASKLGCSTFIMVAIIIAIILFICECTY